MTHRGTRVDVDVVSPICIPVVRNDGVTSLIRVPFIMTIVAAACVMLSGCGPSYSPNTYATNAVQQANKVDSGVIVGVRPVQISASGAVGGIAGAAAGGVAGSQVGAGATSALGAIGGSIVGGIAGVTAEHIVGDSNGFEYIVRKANGDLVSVAQKDEKPLFVGQKVLVIAGAQARIVPDYTVPFDTPPKAAAKPGSPPPAEDAPHTPPADAAMPHPPVGITTAPQIPAAAFGQGSTAPAGGGGSAPVPPAVVPPATSPPASAEVKP
jgi:outer membrane lipoprotein SlyB